MTPKTTDIICLSLEWGAVASFIVVPKTTVTHILYIASVTSLYKVSKLTSDYILKTANGLGKSPVLPDEHLSQTLSYLNLTSPLCCCDIH